MKTKCVHHWEIARAAGETSLGKCKRCGEVRMFRNSMSVPAPWLVNPNKVE